MGHTVWRLLVITLSLKHHHLHSPTHTHTGRGRQVIAVCKSADLLLMVLDAGKPHYHREILTRELESVGVRWVGGRRWALGGLICTREGQRPEASDNR